MSYDLWGRFKYMLSPQFDIYEAIIPLVHGQVCDVGSGTGFGTHLLTRSADFVTGIELDDTALEFANRALGNGNMRFKKADVVSGIGHGIFDVITMIDVIEHIKDDDIAVASVYEALRRGGSFICSTPNKLSRYRLSKYHFREYIPEELETLLGDVFSTVDIVGVDLKPTHDDYYNPIIAVCQK